MQVEMKTVELTEEELKMIRAKYGAGGVDLATFVHKHKAEIGAIESILETHFGFRKITKGRRRKDNG
jgi:hypothetical protein